MKLLCLFMLTSQVVLASEQNLSVSTNETATCRGCQQGVGGCAETTSYDQMSFDFTTATGTEHGYTIDLDCGAAYTFFVRCRDGEGNTNDVSSLIQFSIEEAGDASVPTADAAVPVDAAAPDSAAVDGTTPQLDAAGEDVGAPVDSGTKNKSDAGAEDSSDCGCASAKLSSSWIWCLLVLLPIRRMRRLVQV